MAKTTKKEEEVEGDGPSLSLSDVVALQENLKKDVDFNKPDEELSPEEFVKKSMYKAMDNLVEEKIGKEAKKEIDDSRNKRDALKAFEGNLSRLVELGREVEKNFLWQGAYLINHFDKSEENRFRFVIDKMSTDMVKDQNMTHRERVELANQVLDLIKAYRQQVPKEPVAKQEIVSALLPSIENIYNDTDFSVYKLVGDESIGVAMRNDFKEWIVLSKKLLKSRAKAIEATKEHLDMDEYLPKFVVKNGGDITQTISGMEMHTMGDRMVKLINEADTEEKEIEQKRSKLSEELFGKVDDYIDIGKNEISEEVQSETEVANKGLSVEWAVVIALSVIALAWGVWTAIGVFVLGVIIIGMMQK